MRFLRWSSRGVGLCVRAMLRDSLMYNWRVGVERWSQPGQISRAQFGMSAGRGWRFGSRDNRCETQRSAYLLRFGTGVGAYSVRALDVGVMDVEPPTIESSLNAAHQLGAKRSIASIICRHLNDKVDLAVSFSTSPKAASFSSPTRRYPGSSSLTHDSTSSV